MKTPVLAALILLSTVLLSLSVTAATREWSYDGSNGVYQIVSDGNGGCALLRIVAGGGEVVWLNKKGEVQYQTIVSNVAVGGIVYCTPKNLVFADERERPVVYHVDKKGAVQELPADPHTFNTPLILFPILPNRLADKKGFFAVITETNANINTCVRYSNK